MNEYYNTTIKMRKEKENSTNDGESFYCSKYFLDIDFGTLLERKIEMLLLKENWCT